MRSDFNRVLTEDPRRGSRTKFREYRRAKGNAVFDEEFSGGKESMMKRRRIAKGERKSLGDHLSPLEGWVRKQVGKNWDAVYSEVCRLFDRRSQIKDHVHRHIFRDYVETNTRLVDGKVCLFNRWDGWLPIEDTGWRRRQFYVHPVTGVLCSTRKENEAGHKERAIQEANERRHAVFRVHNKNAHLYFENGRWWVYFLADRPAPHIEYRCPSWWSNLERARWETMTLAEREREGQPVWVRTHVDEIKAPAVPCYAKRSWNRACTMCPNDRYYFEKRVASRKILKAHGLVGQAEFKEDQSTRSHREMSKYR